MCANPKSTIAQLLFAEHPIPNFAKIVGELDVALDRCPATHRSLQMDCEDVAVFELDAMRIVLGIAENPGRGFVCCLTLSVGPCLPEALPPGGPQHDALCHLLANRVLGRFPAETVLWHEFPGPVSADTLDALVDALPNRRDLTAPAPAAATVVPDTSTPAESAAIDGSVVENASVKTRVRSMPKLKASGTAMANATADATHDVVANDRPHLPRPQDADLLRIREALYPVELPAADQRPSTQMRLAAHAMNTTLIIVALPVGAALLTYSLLRGEDMRISARFMALTGAAFGLAQSPLGQQLTAMI